MYEEFEVGSRGMWGLVFGNAKFQMEFFVEEAAAGTVGLEPLAVNDQLRDGALADMADEIGRGGGVLVDVDFGVGEVVGVKELLGGAAVTAPGGSVDGDLHRPILAWRRW